MKLLIFKINLSLWLSLYAFTTVGASTVFVNVKDYGALGDGRNLDSKAINFAIEGAMKAGGGTVYIPAGNYFCGSIRLKSNICLLIDQGATIIAAPVNASNDYDEAETAINEDYQDYGHSHFKNSLIWGYDVENVSIVGMGMINGENLYPSLPKKNGDYKTAKFTEKQTANKAICFFRSRNVILRDFSILSGGWFAVLTTGVDNLTIDNLKIDTNRDGIDLDCCKNVHVSNCHINSPIDDGICPKSTYALGYVRDTENVTITNCQFTGYVTGTLLDGTYLRTPHPRYGVHPVSRFKCGTESNGGFKNITLSNCTFNYCSGIALETVDGGQLEDICISNITMRDVVNAPFFLRLGARMRAPNGTPVGELRRIKINNVLVYNADPNSPCTLSGIPGHDIEDVELSNIHIYYKGGGTLKNIETVIPENEAEYPEPGMFGELPVYGLFVRHAKNLKLDNVEFYTLNEEARLPILFDDVKEAAIRFVKVQKNTCGLPLVLKNCTEISVFESFGQKNRTYSKR